MIAINQDDLGTGGDRVLNGDDGGQVWCRELSNGDKCVVSCLFNILFLFIFLCG